ncbi:Ornithine carbamoyltransferase [Halapricum desulfuricans]|uniref:Ornithine carbamoyltransferase n=1 Tax=Halapricum desulfuricans TaxID=2841257 RepID=A0A897NJU6_9EURY|nr:Ornithine carbamoyltransferase [Halapricum desulfuricans]
MAVRAVLTGREGRATGFLLQLFRGVVRERSERNPTRKRWLPDQAENRLHAQKGLLVWLSEQS